jgi:hypothetical protein
MKVKTNLFSTHSFSVICLESRFHFKKACPIPFWPAHLLTVCHARKSPPYFRPTAAEIPLPFRERE